MMWIFREMNTNFMTIFTNEEDLDIFIKEYGVAFYDWNGEFPSINEDYKIQNNVEANPKFYDTDLPNFIKL